MPVLRIRLMCFSWRLSPSLQFPWQLPDLRPSPAVGHPSKIDPAVSIETAVIFLQEFPVALPRNSERIRDGWGSVWISSHSKNGRAIWLQEPRHRHNRMMAQAPVRARKLEEHYMSRRDVYIIQSMTYREIRVSLVYIICIFRYASWISWYVILFKTVDGMFFNSYFKWKCN